MPLPFQSIQITEGDYGNVAIYYTPTRDALVLDPLHYSRFVMDKCISCDTALDKGI